MSDSPPAQRSDLPRGNRDPGSYVSDTKYKDMKNKYLQQKN